MRQGISPEMGVYQGAGGDRISGASLFRISSLFRLPFVPGINAGIHRKRLERRESIRSQTSYLPAYFDCLRILNLFVAVSDYLLKTP